MEKIELPASSSDLDPTKDLWDQLGLAVHAEVTKTTILDNMKKMLAEESHISV